MKPFRNTVATLVGFLLFFNGPPVSAQLTEAAKQQAVAAHFRTGQEAMKAGRFPDAESEFRKALGFMPEVVEARANLGLVLYLQGKYSETVAELEIVARERPDLPATNVFLGLGYLKLGAPHKAIPRLEKALQSGPSNLEARRALAACYLAVGRYSEAVEQFRALLSHEPDETEAWFHLGRDYMSLMRDLAALLVSGRPESPWTSRLGGDMLALSRHWDAAIPYHEETLETAPGLPGVHRSLGAAHLQMGRWEEAEKRFRAELEIDPLDEAALLGLAEIQVVRGRSRQALENIRRVWETSPRWLLGQANFPVYKAPREAAIALIGRLPSGTADGPTHFLRSVLHDAAGQTDQAAIERRAFEKAARNSAESPAANAATPRGTFPATPPCRRRESTAVPLSTRHSRLPDAGEGSTGPARLRCRLTDVRQSNGIRQRFARGCLLGGKNVPSPG